MIHLYPFLTKTYSILIIAKNFQAFGIFLISGMQFKLVMFPVLYHSCNTQYLSHEFQYFKWKYDCVFIRNNKKNMTVMVGHLIKYYILNVLSQCFNIVFSVCILYYRRRLGKHWKTFLAQSSCLREVCLFRRQPSVLWKLFWNSLGLLRSR